MTVEKLPAAREVTTADVDSWISVASDVIKLANLIAPTEFVPRSLRDSAPATAAAILYGREVGLAPMTALTQTHVIEGKPAMSAEAMRALVYAAGHEIEIGESNSARCEVRGRRHGREKWTSVVWSIDEVKHLLNKDNWKHYPRQMLQARASAELCRLLFPDVIHGFRAIEEFDDLDEVAPPRPDTATPTTKVTRRSGKRAAVKSLPAPVAERPEPVAGPPLPGEPGYNETSVGDSPHTRGSSDTEPGDRPAPGESPTDAQTTTTGDHSPPVVGTEETAAGNGVGEAPDPAAVSEDETPGGESQGGHGESEEPPDLGGTGGSEDRGPRMASGGQTRMLFALLKDLGITARVDRLDVARAICGRPFESYQELTHVHATMMLDTLGRVKSREELDVLLAEFTRRTAERHNKGDRS